MLLTCPECGSLFKRDKCRVQRAKRTPTCGRKCRAASMKMERHQQWKGGRIFNEFTGYWYIRVPGGKYRLEHRVIMERMIGRPLLRTEPVHHINGVSTDNRPENLMLCGDNGEHAREFHGVYNDPVTGQFRYKPGALRKIVN